MANSVGGSVVWNLDVDNRGLRAGLASARSDVDDFGSRAQQVSADTGSHFTSLGSTIAKAVGAFALEETARRFVGFGISSAAGLQTTATSMNLLVGNTQQANAVLGKLYEFSRGTPFAFPDVANAAKTLLQYGITANDVIGITETLGHVVAVTGANYQTLAEVYGQVNAAGKVQMDSIQQLTQDGVPILRAIGEVTGKSFQQISDAMLKGGVSADVFNAAIQKIAPPDALNALANTLPTRLSALQGALRSLAFAFLGISIDPVKGFVVEAGGLFDQFSSGVANLAKSLRSADITSAMGQIGAAFSGIATGAISIFLNTITLVGQSINILIPLLLGVGAAVTLIKLGGLIIQFEAFTATLIAGELAISPFLVVLAVLGAVLGITLGAQLVDTSDKMTTVGGTAKKAGDDVSAANNNIAKSATAVDTTSKAYKDMNEQLAQISQNVLKANRDFDQSLAQIVASHESKIADLRAQVKQEAADFAKAQAEKTASFQKSQEDQARTHQENVGDLQKQLNDELLKGRFADQVRVADLRTRLQRENADYERSTADKLATYQQDTANALDEHNKKTTAFQDQLNTETGFLQKHAAELQGIRGADALDEIQKLQQSHADQLAQYDQQRAKIVQSYRDTQEQGINAQVGAVNKAIKDGTFSNLGNQIGAQFGDSIKNGLTARFQATIQGIKDLFTEITQIVQIYAHYAAGLINPFTSGDTNKKFQDTLRDYLGSGQINFRAAGGPVSSGSPYVVGEQGPELFVPSQSGFIVPNGAKVGGGGVTVYQTNNNYTQFDQTVANRELGYQLAVGAA